MRLFEVKKEKKFKFLHHPNNFLKPKDGET